MQNQIAEPKFMPQSKRALTPRPSFWQLAADRQVVRRAMLVSLIVGTVLAAINHGDHLLSGGIDQAMVLKILLTYCVPYSVSTYSSVLAIRENSITERTGG